jgi:hypothetical protein
MKTFHGRMSFINMELLILKIYIEVKFYPSKDQYLKSYKNRNKKGKLLPMKGI